MKKISYKRVEQHLNKPIWVRFLDHAMNSAAIECICVGILVGIDKEQLKIVSWVSLCETEAERAANNEYFSILKSTIKEIRLLR